MTCLAFFILQNLSKGTIRPLRKLCFSCSLRLKISVIKTIAGFWDSTNRRDRRCRVSAEHINKEDAK